MITIKTAENNAPMNVVLDKVSSFSELYGLTRTILTDGAKNVIACKILHKACRLKWSSGRLSAKAALFFRAKPQLRGQGWTRKTNTLGD
jgi:hypothetical protein